MNFNFPYELAAKLAREGNEEVNQLVSDYKRLHDNYQHLLAENTTLKNDLTVCENTVKLLQIGEE